MLMDNWGEVEFNEPYSGKEITKINDVFLPEDYLSFIKEHNGGEGDLGNTWFVLYPLEELQEINDDCNVSEYLPGRIIIASNGGGEFYGIDKDGSYFNVPETFEEKYICILGNDFESLPEKINALWTDEEEEEI